MTPDPSSVEVEAVEAAEPPKKRTPELAATGIFKRDIDYYAACMQPRRTGLSGIFLRWLMGPLTLDAGEAERVRALADDGVIVYVSRTCNALDYLAYEHVLAAEGLPLARFANHINLMPLQSFREMGKTLWAKLTFWVRGRRMPSPQEMGFLKNLTIGGKSSLVFLFRPETWFDQLLRPMWYPMESIVAAQRELDRPVRLVPLMLVMERSAPSLRKSVLDVLMGPRLSPGRIRRLGLLLRYRKRARVRIGEPIDLQDFITKQVVRANRPRSSSSSLPAVRGDIGPVATAPSADAELARKLRWVLRNYLFRELRVLLGPPRKPRSRVLDRVVRRMQPDLEAYAQRGGRSLLKLKSEAHSCLDEIAANPDRNVLEVWKGVIGWGMRHLFDGIDGPPAEEVEELKRRMRKAPLIVIPNHRSHLDYQIALNYLDDSGIVPPLTAAGINLAFWPLGMIARRCHAFFIRRTFRGSAVYSMAFRHYLAYVLREGYPVMFFIEGTRSRGGKVLPPKLGMLTMIVETLLETGSFDDLTIAPMAIGYDKVIEETSLMNELSGRPKEPESLFGMLSIHRLLQRRYGKISIRLGELISVKDYLADNPLPERSGRANPAFRRALGGLGQRVAHQLGAAQAVHPSALLATVLLTRPEGIVAYGQLLRGADRLLEWLSFIEAPLADALTRQVDRALADAVSLFQTGNLVRLERDLGPWGAADPWAGVLSVDPQRRLALDYYRNNALHHLAPLAILASALEVSGDWAQVERDFSFLWELLTQEFQHAPGADWQEELERATQFLERKRLLFRSGDTYVVPERAARTLRFYRQPLSATLESYRTALRFLALLERGGFRPRNQVIALVQYAQMELRRGRLSWPESISTANYGFALGYFKANSERGFEYFRRRLDSLIEPVDRDAPRELVDS